MTRRQWRNDRCAILAGKRGPDAWQCRDDGRINGRACREQCAGEHQNSNEREHCDFPFGRTRDPCRTNHRAIRMFRVLWMIAVCSVDVLFVKQKNGT